MNRKSPTTPITDDRGGTNGDYDGDGSGDIQRTAAAYWARELADLADPVALPTDRNGPSVLAGCGARREFSFGPERSADVARLAAECGASTQALLLASLAVLIYRYTGLADLIVGAATCTCSRAPHPTTECRCAEMLPIRTRFPDGVTFSDLLRAVHDALNRAQAHADVAPSTLARLLREDRDENGSLPFPAIFTFVDGDAAAALTLNAAPTDLAITARQSHGDIAIAIDYDADLFSKARILRLVDHWRTLMHSLAADPDAPISTRDILPAWERQRVLRDWNDTDIAWPVPSSLVHELVEAQAARTPDAVALVFEDRSVTYREMDEAANRIANRLLHLGVGVESAVGVLLDRSIEMVTGILGVVKAGAAYVPLDVSLPKARLEHIVREADVRAVITTSNRREILWDGNAASIAPALLVDGDGRATLEACSPTKPDVSLTPDNLAYIIYTSGSTGRPKGAMNTHRGICNRLLWMQAEYQLDATEVFLQKTPYSFDISVWEFFEPLIVGGRLVIAQPDGHRDPEYLAELIGAAGVTTAHFVPSMLYAFLEAQNISDAVRLKRVFCSGEALPLDLQTRFFERLPAELHNLYGPTEAAVEVTYWACERSSAGSRSSVPIGRPIANTQIYLLDDRLQPVPIGITGHLHIGGVAVARGYVARPELTAERFIPDPFSASPEERLYRTGDLARWATDGAIEYLGRADDQVKVRGFRIELGDVEAALREHPAVRECAVALRHRTVGDRQDATLTAYVVPPSGATPSWSDLRTFLRSKLPEYMIPAAFVALAALPLTSSGKTDRRALPEPARDDVLGRDESARSDRIAPRTDLERTLAEVWTELLGVGHVGIDDDFFALGGHSLLVARLGIAVRDRTGLRLPFRSVFETPTIRHLAHLLSADTPVTRPDALIRRRDAAGPAPLSFPQAAFWFLWRLDPQSAYYNVFLLYRVAGPLDDKGLAWSLDSLVARHEPLRTVFETRAGTPAPRLLPPAPVPIRRIDLTAVPAHQREEELREQAAEEAHRPFDLERDLPVRAALWSLGDADRALLITVPHIAFDGVSRIVFERELARLYDAHRRGDAPDLPDLPIRYQDFAAWQREVVTETDIADAVAYWTAELAGAPRQLHLPADHPRPLLRSNRGASLLFTIEPTVVRALETLARQEMATLFMVFTAALQSLLHRWSGQDDIVIATIVAGRAVAETLPLIGSFVNMLPLRTRLTGEPSFRTAVRFVREGALRAYAHQDVPFDRLVQGLNVERTAGALPLTQVVLSLDPDTGDGLQLSGVRCRADDIPSRTSKCDLLLTLAAAGDRYDARLEYDTDLFLPDTAARMRDHLLAFLRSVAANPDQGIADVPMLGAAELAQIRAWSGGDVPRDRIACAAGAGVPTDATRAPDLADSPRVTVHSLFEEQVRRTPGAVALRVAAGDAQPDNALTYDELNRRANRLARCLRRDASVRPGDRVALFSQRCPDLIVAILAILKCRAAYVPLSPAYPAERIAWMLQDTAPKALLAQRRLLDAMDPRPDDIPILVLEDIERRIAGLPDDDAGEGLGAIADHADDLAYVMYTSGSTGTPRGVCVPHRGVTRLVCGPDYVHLGSEETLLQFAPVSFDAATFEIWGALLNGASLVLYPDDGPVDLRALAKTIAAERITTLWLTAELFHQMVDSLGVEWCRAGSLRQLLSGGDVLSPARVRRVLEAAPGLRLVNGYGPTENTTFTCCHTMSSPDQVGDPVSIGRPIRGTTVHILDRHLRPLPIGVVGELCAGGDGVAVGYLNQPELSAQRFVQDPFAGRPGALLYRTGDQARFLPDGTIEFCGRLDSQVKIRGYRIELGEIEAAIDRFPGVRESVVVAKSGERAHDEPVGSRRGEKRLVAYVVPNDPAAPIEIPALRAFLSRSLPDYMLPPLYVSVSSIPMSPNGKRDIDALPPPSGGVVGDPADASYEGLNRHGQPFEYPLLQIWRQLFPDRPIGIDDSFFDLGGHSLLAAEMAMRIETEMKRTMPLAQIIRTPTVRQLAERLLDQELTDAQAVTVVTEGRRDVTPLFFFHGDFHGAGYYCHRMARTIGSSRPFFAISPLGACGEAIPWSIEEMASVHLAQIRARQPHGPYLLGGYCNGASAALEMARLLLQAGEAVAGLILVDPPTFSALRRRLLRVLHGLLTLQGVRSQKRVEAVLRLLTLASLARRGSVHRTDFIELMYRTDFNSTGDELFNRYRTVLWAYTGKRYPGHAVVMRTHDLDPPVTDNDVAFHLLARTVDIVTLPGDHDSVILHHTDDLASEIARCLDAVERHVTAR
jgi:amino acid adenylation domain-containing protein